MMTPSIPKNLDEMARDWSKHILCELQKHGRVKFHAEDVLSAVMLRLVESNITAKFWEGVAEQSHVLYVTVSQAAKMLGITVGAFLAHQIECVGSERLEPAGMRVKGEDVPVEPGTGYTSPNAIYLFDEVMTLAATKHFPDQIAAELPVARPPTVSQWKAYLTRAVLNNSANYCRHNARHFAREHQPDMWSCFRNTEGELAFEELIEDPQATHGRSIKERGGPNVTSIEALEARMDLAALINRAPGLKNKKTPEGADFFDLILNGSTFREAVRAVGLTKRERQVILQHLG